MLSASSSRLKAMWSAFCWRFESSIVIGCSDTSIEGFMASGFPPIPPSYWLCSLNVSGASYSSFVPIPSSFALRFACSGATYSASSVLLSRICFSTASTYCLIVLSAYISSFIYISSL